MKNTRLKRILNSLLCLALAVTLGTAVGTTLGKYVFSGTVGTFSLNIVPRVVPAEAIMGMVPEGGTLTRIVYDKWNDGYTDSGVTPAVTITADEWQNEGDATYDPNQPKVRMFAKQHDGANYTVYVLSDENIYAPKGASYMFAGSRHGGDLADNVTEIVLRNFHFHSDADVANFISGCKKLTTLSMPGVNFSSVSTADALLGSVVTTLDLSESTFSPTQLKDLLKQNTRKITHLDISNANIMGNKWDEMFNGASALVTIDGFETLNSSNVTSLKSTFYNCMALGNDTFTKFAEMLARGNKITNLSNAFNTCRTLNLEAFNAIIKGLADGNESGNKITTLQQTFQYCSGIVGNVDLSALDLSALTNIRETFHSCSSIRSVTFPEAPNVKDMYRLFCACALLESVDMLKVGTANVTNMNGIFYDCRALTSVDISNFDTSNVTQMSLSSKTNGSFYGMFGNCYALKTVYVGEGWNTSKVTASTEMFKDCTALVGGNGTTYDANHIDATYARIDTEGQPGYFTAINSSEAPAVVLDTTGMQNLSAELMDLGSTFAEDSKQSYGILLIPADGFLLPETFTITIGEIIYTVSTAPDAANPEGFAWISEDSLLMISGELLPEGGTIFVTAEAIPEAEPTMALDLSQVSNVTVFMDGTIVTDSISLTGEAITLTLQANGGYVLPDSFTVAIGEITYTVTTADGTVADGTGPITDITYADSVLTIVPTLLREDMRISMNIIGEKVITDTDGEETPTEGTDTPTEGKETPAEGTDTPTEGEETPTEGTGTPTEGEETPIEGGDTPTEGEETSAEDSDTSAVGEDTTDSSDKTTETKETPSENGDAPAGSEVTSSEGGEAPDAGGEVPSEADDTPTDGEDPAAV